MSGHCRQWSGSVGFHRNFIRWAYRETRLHDAGVVESISDPQAKHWVLSSTCPCFDGWNSAVSGPGRAGMPNNAPKALKDEQVAGILLGLNAISSVTVSIFCTT